MTIVTSSYRPKRPLRKKRKQPPLASAIVTPAPLKPIKGPVIRLREQRQANDNGAPDQQPKPKRPVIVEPKRKRTSIFGDAPDLTEEELQRRGDAAAELWREWCAGRLRRNARIGSGLRARLRRHFPHVPSSRQEIYVRLPWAIIRTQSLPVHFLATGRSQMPPINAWGEG